MLVLTRRASEKIHVGDNITIHVVRIGPNTVKIGIDAPKEIPITRSELPRETPNEIPNGIPLCVSDSDVVNAPCLDHGHSHVNQDSP